MNTFLVEKLGEAVGTDLKDVEADLNTLDNPGFAVGYKLFP